jgi:serine/threonine protein phosphatase PrpC
LRSGFARAEQEFTEKNYQAMVDGVQRPMILDKSGSCALVVLIVGDMCYIANVGDSRAILCRNGKAINLSHDHKTVKSFTFN